MHSTATYFDLYNSLSFKIIDKANSKFDLKNKESLHINWRKPKLNTQQTYFLSLYCCCCFVYEFLFHLLFSSSLTLTISIFYCLNYTSLLLHFITTQLVSHLSLSSIIFIISTLTIIIFYCLNYTSLLLHLVITHLGMSHAIIIKMDDKEIYQNSSKKHSQKNYRGSFGDYCCIPRCQSAFYDANRVKTGIGLFKLPKHQALCKKWLQVIERYRRTGGADKFSKTKKVMVCEFHFNPNQIQVSLEIYRKTYLPESAPSEFEFYHEEEKKK